MWLNNLFGDDLFGESLGESNFQNIFGPLLKTTFFFGWFIDIFTVTLK